jgi:hypothetical protein
VNEWLESFYKDPDLKRTLLEAFLPAFDGYVAEALGGPVPAEFVESLASSYVDRHLGSSLAQLQEIVGTAADPLAALSERFDEWEEKRPTKVARNEMVRSANAAAVQQMRERGVTKKVWVTSGGSCPFCVELDGTVIEVDSFFFTEGDELNPEGAEAPMHFESSLGHPPIHQGCNCTVEAVTETELVARTEGDFDHPEAVDSALDEFNGTWTDDQEQSIVLDPVTGEARWRGTGEVTSVDMSGLSDDIWRDSVMVHTHPRDGAFSAADLGLMIEKDVAEMRVTGPTRIFVIKRPEGGWVGASRSGVSEHWNQNFADGAKLPKDEVAQLTGGGDSWALNVNNYAVQVTAETYGWEYRVLAR